MNELDCLRVVQSHMVAEPEHHADREGNGA